MSDVLSSSATKTQPAPIAALGIAEEQAVLASVSGKADSLLASFMEESSDFIVSLRPSGRVVYANAQMRDLMNIEFERLGSLNLRELCPPEVWPFVESMIEELVSKGSGSSRVDEVPIGTRGWISLASKSWPDAEGNVGLITGTGRDITGEVLAKQQAEAIRVQLAEANKRLTESNRDLQDFAYVASHDLQEPLRKIVAFSDRLASNYGDELDEKGLDYLGRVQNAASRMQQLIEDLLAFSRVSSTAQQHRSTNLNEILAGVLSDLEVAISESNAVVDVGLLPTIQAEPTQMRQLFQNLISNALKFRKPDVDPHVVIEATSAADNRWRITVSDNGIGFDQKYEAKIFTVFQRLHGRSSYDGSGVGLSVCRRIVERHDGQLSVVAAEGAGASFNIVVPAD